MSLRDVRLRMATGASALLLIAVVSSWADDGPTPAPSMPRATGQATLKVLPATGTTPDALGPQLQFGGGAAQAPGSGVQQPGVGSQLQPNAKRGTIGQGTN